MRFLFPTAEMLRKQPYEDGPSASALPDGSRAFRRKPARLRTVGPEFPGSSGSAEVPGTTSRHRGPFRSVPDSTFSRSRWAVDVETFSAKAVMAEAGAPDGCRERRL